MGVDFPAHTISGGDGSGRARLFFAFCILVYFSVLYRVYTGSFSLYTGSHRPQIKLVLTARMDLDCPGKILQIVSMSHSIRWQYAGRHLDTISLLGSLAGICDS
jgi:hypothetical protein